MNISKNVPTAIAPLVDQGGLISPPWFQFFVGLAKEPPDPQVFDGIEATTLKAGTIEAVSVFLSADHKAAVAFESTKFVFRYNGAAIMSLDTSGNVRALGTITPSVAP